MTTHPATATARHHRRDRPRRRLGAAIAVALTLPLTALPAAPANAYPDGVRLRPGALPRGADTDLLHTEGSVLVDDDRRIRVRAADVRVLGRDGAAYVVQTHDARQERWRLLRVRRNGNARTLTRGTGYGPDVHLDEAARQVLLVGSSSGGGTRITVRDATTGDVTGGRGVRGDVTVVDAHDHDVVLTRWNKRVKTLRWDTGSNRIRRVSRRPAYLADVATNRLGLLFGDPYRNGCQRLVRLDRPRTTVWRSCRDRVLSLSPHARRMVTTDLLSDGAGPRMVQVRNGRGRLLRTFRSEWFGFMAWENDRELLLQTSGRKAVAALRLTPRNAERASDSHGRRGREPWAAMDWTVPRS